MGLHSVFSNSSNIWWWYYAIPTNRRGRAHLLRVPTVELDTIRITIPSWVHSPETWVNQLAEKPFIPRETDGSNERACHTRQRAHHYESLYNGPQSIYRGICQTCFDAAPELMDITSYRPYQATHHFGTDTTSWQTAVENQYYRDR